MTEAQKPPFVCGAKVALKEHNASITVKWLVEHVFLVADENAKGGPPEERWLVNIMRQRSNGIERETVPADCLEAG